MKSRVKYFLMLILFSLLPFFIQGQGEFNNWYFGYGAGITFNYGAPLVLTNCASYFSLLYCPGVISDSLGNLLFYADYYRAFNRNHEVMLNGTGLASLGPVRQPCFIIQTLNDDSLYYLFTMDHYYDPIGNPDPQGLCYSIIDMRFAGGLGGIVSGQKNIHITGTENTCTAMTATRHKNNRYAWIVVRKYVNSNEYLSYRLTSTGINMTPVISYSLFSLYWNGTGSKLKYIKISPDGSKIVCTADTIAELSNFDSDSGIITPLFTFRDPPALWHQHSIEFSLDSRFLYVVKSNSLISKIYQYDCSKTDSLEFIQSAVFIGNVPEYSGLQRGPDNKIYVTVCGKDSISVINNPEIQGVGCGLQLNILGLNGKTSWSGFPQFLQRYYVYPHFSGQCQNRPVLFSATIWPPADSVYWNFGDPGSGAFNISNDPDPWHIYNDTGSYNVMLIVRHNDKRFDTAWLTVQIH